MTLPAAAPIPRRLLHDEVAEHLRAAILSGDLEPHSRLNEIELAERFGISRTPLREAIRILSAEGLVALLPNRGARVTGICAREVDEILEVVAALEASAGALAAERATPDQIREIAAATELMRQAYDRRDEAAYFPLNRTIHGLIMDAAHNATLATLYGQLSSRIQRLRYTAHKTETQWAAAMADHEAMVTALERRNGEALSVLMRRHVLSKRHPIVDSFGESERPVKGPLTIA